MSKEYSVYSKVILHEGKSMGEGLKDFFIANNLIGYKALNYKHLLEALDTNIDLGAIFLSLSSDEEGRTPLDVVKKIQRLRPELPVFLRLNGNGAASSIPRELEQLCTGVYQQDDMSRLKELIDTYIFNMYYPSSVIRGIIQLTREILPTVFFNTDFECDPPYLVRDKIIYGKLFSLIPLDSHWCRGYMMIQADEQPVIDMIRQGKTHYPSDREDVGFREVNNVLSELTNLIWGRFKTRFYHDSQDYTIFNIQVPIIVNHLQKYITFGSKTPQLCFRYTLHDRDNKHAPIPLYQKFIFHLNWSPENYVDEGEDEMNSLLQGGNLVVF